MDDTSAAESLLAAERERLIAYCASLIGERDAADDIVQEVFVTALRLRDRVREPDAWVPFLYGIARNLCLRWRRARSRRWARESPFEGEIQPLTDTGDADDRLIASEVTLLLDRALALLPATTHRPLIAWYADGRSLEEIAALRGIRRNTAAVQVHRARRALKDALNSPELRDDARALGLLDESAQPDWRETRIWCPSCGKRHLHYMLKRKEDKTWFGLRCPDCDSADPYELSLGPAGSRHCLEGVRMARPALKRATSAFRGFAEHMAGKSEMCCGRCGLQTPVRLVATESDLEPRLVGRRGLFQRCKCGGGLSMAAEDIARSLERLERFWSRHERIRTVPARAMSDDALIVSFESVAGSARLDVVLDAHTMKVRDISGR